MTDELDRIRSLRDEVPPPSTEWVQQTRAELLTMAADEEEEQAGPVAAADQPAGRGVLASLARSLERVTSRPLPAALAGAALLVAVVAGIGVVLDSPSTEEPDVPVAGESADPEATPTTPPAQEDQDQPEQDGVVLASSCEGADGTYTIEYPEGWHTNEGDVTTPCSRFAEEPVEVEAQTGGAPEQPVVVEVLPVELDRASDPGRASRETARDETTVDGRDAVVVEWTSTGEAAVPEGIRSYRYLVDLGEDRTLMVAAYEIGEPPFDEYRQAVDAMVESLDLES